MQLHQLRSKKNQLKKRIGRGGKRGSYSGRGIKGQKARAGGRPRPAWRDIIKKIPKKRGYRFKSRQSKSQVVNLKDLEKFFSEGEEITPEKLLKKNLIGKIESGQSTVKILGQGKLTKKLKVKGCQLSKSAKKALEIK